MRVVITGATGNVGTSIIDALGADDAVGSIVGLARRVPDTPLPKTTWARADVTEDDLVPHFRGADCVIHLAWLIQPSHNEALLERTNVAGSRRVFDAAAAAGVSTLVYASSVGAYSPAPKDRLVDETWPTNGIETSFYARHKAAVERILDDFESEHPRMRVVRLRPALIFKSEAATEIRRLFFGPLLPSPLLRAGLIPLVPKVRDLVFQTVHSYDVGEAYRLAAVNTAARGAFNIAADPVIDVDELAAALDARPVPVPARVLRAGAAITWRLHLQPTPEGWVDMGLNAPVMDSSRARSELGWTPKHSAIDALHDLLEGLRTEAARDTPPLRRETSGRGRIREFLTGIGRSGGARRE